MVVCHEEAEEWFEGAEELLAVGRRKGGHLIHFSNDGVFCELRDGPEETGGDGAHVEIAESMLAELVIFFLRSWD